MRDESTEVAGSQTAERHRRAILPVHIAFDYEHNYRHASQATRQKFFSATTCRISPGEMKLKAPIIRMPIPAPKYPQ